MDINELYVKLKVLGNSIKILNIQTLIVSDNVGQQLYYIDKQNNKLYKSCIYDSLTYIEKLKMLITKSNEKFGLIRYNTEELIKPIYKSIKIIDNTLIVLIDNTLGVYNKDLDQIIPSIYNDIDFIFKLNTEKYLIKLLDKESDSVYYIVNKNTYKRINIDIDAKVDISSTDYLVGDNKILNIKTLEYENIEDMVDMLGTINIWTKENHYKINPSKNYYS